MADQVPTTLWERQTTMARTQADLLARSFLVLGTSATRSSWADSLGGAGGGRGEVEEDAEEEEEGRGG